MKKLGLIVAALMLLVGCDSVMNTPTKKVEVFLNKYQTLDNDVLDQLDEVITQEGTLSESQKESYTSVIKNQYQNLTYTIKDETVDGNSAIVEVEIEVKDLTKAMTKADEYLVTNPDEFKNELGEIDNEKFIEYKLNSMKDYQEKVKYTITFTLTKIDKEWQLDEITEEIRQKIHGIYNYE